MFFFNLLFSTSCYMQDFIQAIQQMIDISETELHHFLSFCSEKKIKKKTPLTRVGVIPHQVFFVTKGLVRVVVEDGEGQQHSIHFALEGQFICDYACFMQKKPALYYLETLEDSELVVLPRSGIESGYEHLQQGDRLGRKIAEFYFIYYDNRIKNGYTKTPKQRYDAITEVFPNIHNRVPQHMIASYLGITSVHLSRLKKSTALEL